MKDQKTSELTETGQAKLTTLMHAVVETRSQLARTRSRLRKVEEKVRDNKKNEMEARRAKALSDYIEAIEKARKARTRLLNRLQKHSA